jgi:hypothetical protein
MVRNISVNHGLINPLDLYIINAPVRDLPATIPYCCPVAVLEWKAGRVFILSPVVIPESFIYYYSHLHDLRVAIFTVRRPACETYAR